MKREEINPHPLSYWLETHLGAPLAVLFAVLFIITIVR